MRKAFRKVADEFLFLKHTIKVIEDLDVTYL